MKIERLLIVFFILYFTSCTYRHYEVIGIDVAKSSKREMHFDDICTGIKIIPIQDSILYGKHPKICVSDRSVFVLDEISNSVNRYGFDGLLEERISLSKKIVDFSIYKNEYIDILTSESIECYDFHSNKLICQLPVSDTISIISVARWNDKEINFFGYNNNGDFVGTCNTEKGRLSCCMNRYPICREDGGQAISGSRFFHCGDELFMYYANSGNIWRFMMFQSPGYIWDYSGDNHKNIVPFLSSYQYGLSKHFHNVQMTSRMIYGVFEQDGNEMLFLFDRETFRCVIQSYLASTPNFPIGCIEKDKNFFICHSSDLHLYISPSLLDEKSANDYYSAIRKGCDALIIYSLKTV